MISSYDRGNFKIGRIKERISPDTTSTGIIIITAVLHQPQKNYAYGYKNQKKRHTNHTAWPGFTASLHS